MFLMADHKKTALAVKGQVLLEFTFCMIIVFLMIFGVTKAFIWGGIQLADRAVDHDKLLVTRIAEGYGETCSLWGEEYDCFDYYGTRDICQDCIGEWTLGASGPLRQIDPYYHTPIKMKATWVAGE